MKLMNFKSRSAWKPRTARDYVQDGLIAMWDGIENAGWGVHDPNATTWKDLVSGDVTSQSTIASFGDDHIKFSELTSYGLRDDCDYQTSEVIFQPDDDTQMLAFISMYNRTCIGSMTSSVGTGLYQSVSFGENVAGKTIHAVARYDLGSNSAESAFVNGVKTSSFTSGNWSNPISRSLYIGGPYSKKFKGKVFAIRIYNRKLTDDEVAANYAVDRARFKIGGAS